MYCDIHSIRTRNLCPNLFFNSSYHWRSHGPKKVDSNIGKSKLVCSQSFWWQHSHLRWFELSNSANWIFSEIYLTVAWMFKIQNINQTFFMTVSRCTLLVSRWWQSTNNSGTLCFGSNIKGFLDSETLWRWCDFVKHFPFFKSKIFLQNILSEPFLNNLSFLNFFNSELNQPSCFGFYIIFLRANKPVELGKSGYIWIFH